MARHGHVATPRVLTWTHAGTYVVLRINRAKHIGPTGIVGPGDRIGGLLGLVGDAKHLGAFPLYRQSAKKRP